MRYTHTHESEEAARAVGRLCCCVCLLDLGDARDPYRDPSCPRCEAKEYADEVDDRDESPIEWSDATADRWDFDSDPDWR